MKIEFIDNEIVISDLKPLLKKYHISQFAFLGFRKEEDVFYKNTLKVKKDLIDLLDYLEFENIQFSVGLNLDRILNEIELNKKEVTEKLKYGNDIKEGKIETKDFDSFTRYTDTLPRKLRTHQIKAAYHLYKLKNGANFSVPGSGKTSVVLSVYEKFKRDSDCNLLFVIGPPSSFQPWQNEFKETLGRIPDTQILSGGNSVIRKSEYYNSVKNSSELYLTTFHSINNDFQDAIHFLNQKGINAFLIIDEAHYFKRIGGSWANSLLKVAEYAKYKCVLTGTPIPKSYKDLFNLFDFLWVGNSPLTDKDRIQIDIWEQKNKSQEVKELLNEKIGPLFYRVRKKDLGLQEAMFHEPIIIKMNKAEERIYSFLKSKIHDLSNDEYFENIELLHKLWKGRMIRLRQVTSYPKLLLSAVKNYSEDLIVDSELQDLIENYDNYELTGKLEKLTEIVLNLNRENKKVLIWSNFIGTLELIKKHFKSLKLNSELIYGKTPSRRNLGENTKDIKTREDIRDIFVDVNSGLDILIANPAACAESISLHKTCFHAIYYDLSYNCAQYLQSLDRIHRVGGSETQQANYYFLQYENSIDMDIKSNLEQKAQKMYDIVEEDYEIYNLDMFDTIEDDDIRAYKRLFIKN